MDGRSSRFPRCVVCLCRWSNCPQLTLTRSVGRSLAPNNHQRSCLLLGRHGGRRRGQQRASLESWRGRRRRRMDECAQWADLSFSSSRLSPSRVVVSPVSGPVVGAGCSPARSHWLPFRASTPLFSQPKIPLPVALWSPGPAEPSHWSLFHKKQFRRTITGPLLIPASATPGGLSRFWAGGQLGGLGQAWDRPGDRQGMPGEARQAILGRTQHPPRATILGLVHDGLEPGPSPSSMDDGGRVGSWWPGSLSPRQRHDKPGQR